MQFPCADSHSKTGTLADKAGSTGTAAPCVRVPTIWNNRETHLIMTMRHRADCITGCVDSHCYLQALQDNRIGTEEFISQGVLSLCLRSLAAQDSGLRYNIEPHPVPEGNRAMSTSSKFVSLAIAPPGHDMMVNTHGSADKKITIPGAHALLASANDRDTRQHAPDGLASHSSNSFHKWQVKLLAWDMTK